MSSGFEGTKGPYLRQNNTVYALESCGYRRGHEQFRNRMSALIQGGPDTPSDELEAVAELFAEAGAVVQETGLTPRQLAEQRAELLEVLSSTRSVLACSLKSAAPDFFESDEDVSGHIQIKKIDTVIANATQQRNATGGEE